MNGLAIHPLGATVCQSGRWLVARIRGRRPHPEQGYRACLRPNESGPYIWSPTATAHVNTRSAAQYTTNLQEDRAHARLNPTLEKMNALKLTAMAVVMVLHLTSGADDQIRSASHQRMDPLRDAERWNLIEVSKECKDRASTHSVDPGFWSKWFSTNPAVLNTCILKLYVLITWMVGVFIPIDFGMVGVFIPIDWGNGRGVYF